MTEQSEFIKNSCTKEDRQGLDAPHWTLAEAGEVDMPPKMTNQSDQLMIKPSRTAQMTQSDTKMRTCGLLCLSALWVTGFGIPL